MSTSEAIYDATHAILTANQSVGSFYADLGGRVFNTIALPNPDQRQVVMPFLVYNWAILTPEIALGRQNDVSGDLNISVFGEIDAGARAVLAIAGKVSDALSGAKLVIAGYNGGELLRTQFPRVEGSDSESLRALITFRLLECHAT
jgi:hypothetical protein